MALRGQLAARARPASGASARPSTAPPARGGRRRPRAPAGAWRARRSPRAAPPPPSGSRAAAAPRPRAACSVPRRRGAGRSSRAPRGARARAAAASQWAPAARRGPRPRRSAAPRRAAARAARGADGRALRAACQRRGAAARVHAGDLGAARRHQVGALGGVPVGRARALHAVLDAVAALRLHGPAQDRGPVADELLADEPVAAEHTAVPKVTGALRQLVVARVAECVDARGRRQADGGLLHAKVVVALRRGHRPLLRTHRPQRHVQPAVEHLLAVAVVDGRDSVGRRRQVLPHLGAAPRERVVGHRDALARAAAVLAWPAPELGHAVRVHAAAQRGGRDRVRGAGAQRAL